MRPIVIIRARRERAYYPTIIIVGSHWQRREYPIAIIIIGSGWQDNMNGRHAYFA